VTLLEGVPTELGHMLHDGEIDLAMSHPWPAAQSSRITAN
jgi:hypothetical protein